VEFCSKKGKVCFKKWKFYFNWEFASKGKVCFRKWKFYFENDNSASKGGKFTKFKKTKNFISKNNPSEKISHNEIERIFVETKLTPISPFMII
jgi:hypothetical protein